MTTQLSRRAFLAGLGLLLDGCASPTGVPSRFASMSPEYVGAYGPMADGDVSIPGLDLATISSDLLRQEVAFRGPYRPGTVVVNVPERRLYLVQPGGKALRYAVGVGRNEALDFRGSAAIGRKAEWPRWAPTPNMIAHMPMYAAYAGGMPGGLGNPLGARALYLYRGNQDTHFRLHGTNEPTTIGQAVSSGCIRLFNQDIIDLYNRVPIGAPVVVLQDENAARGYPEEAPPSGGPPSGGAAYGSAPYGGASYGSAPYGGAPPGGPPYGEPLYGGPPYEGPYYDGPLYERPPYDGPF